MLGPLRVIIRHEYVKKKVAVKSFELSPSMKEISFLQQICYSYTVV
jgi:hypothetical protein